jgi:hypothetical protein
MRAQNYHGQLISNDADDEDKAAEAEAESGADVVDMSVLQPSKFINGIITGVLVPDRNAKGNPEVADGIASDEETADADADVSEPDDWRWLDMEVIVADEKRLLFKLLMTGAEAGPNNGDRLKSIPRIGVETREESIRNLVFSSEFEAESGIDMEVDDVGPTNPPFVNTLIGFDKAEEVREFGSDARSNED